jgi:hypothetical protein
MIILHYLVNLEKFSFSEAAIEMQQGTAYPSGGSEFTTDV